MRVSFCTTCKGRLHHLRATLPKNLEDNSDYSDLEFVVLDYNSSDGMAEWIRRSLSDQIRSRRVVYFRERTARNFHFAHAKNVAHLLATGDIVCNVDADNFTGRGYAGRLAEQFLQARERKLMVTASRGSLYGRIAISKENFDLLRGYDEDLAFGWGWEDWEFRTRAANLGFEDLSLVVEGMAAIPHPNADRLRFGPSRGKFRRQVHLHKGMIEARRSRGEWDVNMNRAWGVARVYRNFEEEPIKVGRPG